MLCIFRWSTGWILNTWCFFFYISDQRQIYHPMPSSILTVLADSGAGWVCFWLCCILTLEVSGIKKKNKGPRKALSSFYPNVVLGQKYKKYLEVNQILYITDTLCCSIWKPSRPGLCKLFRNEHKHLWNIWFREMKTAKQTDFLYECLQKGMSAPCASAARAHFHVISPTSNYHFI